MRLRGWLTAALVVLIPPSCVGSCALHDHLLDLRFQRVALGMPRNEVADVLGTPRNILDCTAPGPFTPWRRPDCAETYLYPSWGAPIVPEMWVVWFDANGLAIDKYRFVSW